jgi:hypothetical protein
MVESCLGALQVVSSKAGFAMLLRLVAGTSYLAPLTTLLAAARAALARKSFASSGQES